MRSPTVAPVSVVAGDPASCSQLGGTLRQLATRLRTTGRAAHDAFDDGDDDPPGAGRSAQARRRVDAARCRRRRGGRARSTGSARPCRRTPPTWPRRSPTRRRLTARATQAGLRVSDEGEVAAAWGVSGVADGAASAQQLEVLERLQSELDAVASLVAQRRHRLVVALRESQTVLATHAGALRR